MFTQAYTPEQAAHGKLENGHDVLILYIKEYNKEVKAIRQSGLSKYTYNWFATELKDAFVLQLTWEDGTHIQVRFDKQHAALLEQLHQPTDLILTTVPISQLITKAENTGADFLEFEDALTFSQLTFALSSALQ